jgi:hypothetical protein
MTPIAGVDAIAREAAGSIALKSWTVHSGSAMTGGVRKESVASCDNS